MPLAGIIRGIFAGLSGVVLFCGAIHADPLFIFTDEEFDLGALLDDIPGLIAEGDSLGEWSSLPLIGSDAAALIALRDSLGRLPDREDTSPLPPLQDLVMEQLGMIVRTPGGGYGVSLRSGLRYRPGDGQNAGSRYYSRMRISVGDRLTGVFLGERDPGERRTLDLLSGSISYDARGLRLTAGDYRPGFGQGLVFARYGRSYVSGVDAMQREPAAIANTSFEESAYLRGVHAELKRARWFVQGWLSSRRRDATLDDDGHAVTIRATGYHLPGGERDNLRERLGAARAGIMPAEGIELTAAGSISEYTPRLAQGDRESDLHDPAGAVFRHLSLSGRLERDIIRIYAEAATLAFEHNAVIGGIDVDGGPVRAALLARRYDTGYWSPRPGAFSSFGRTGNEEGVYAALNGDLPGGITATAALDIARTIARTYSSPMPAARRRVQVVTGKRFPGGIGVRLAVRSTASTGAGYDDRANAALQLEERPGRGVPGWRVIAAHSAGSGDSGRFGEAALLFNGWLDGELAVGVFDIPSYAARYYRYERDVPGRGMTRPVWGRGGAMLLLLRHGAFAARIAWRDSDLMSVSRDLTMQYDAMF